MRINNPDELFDYERLSMGDGEAVLHQTTALYGGGWMIVYDYTNTGGPQVKGMVLRQRRLAVSNPEGNPAVSIILSSERLSA